VPYVSILDTRGETRWSRSSRGKADRADSSLEGTAAGVSRIQGESNTLVPFSANLQYCDQKNFNEENVSDQGQIFRKGLKSCRRVWLLSRQRNSKGFPPMLCLVTQSARIKTEKKSMT